MSKAIAEALCKAQASILGVDKKGKHKHYDYTAIDDMVAACRGALYDEGRLVLIPTSHRVEDKVMVTEWLLAHGESGDSIPLRYDMPIVSAGGQGFDKAAAGAASQALNYLLRDLLLLPRGTKEARAPGSGTHVEVDAREDSRRGAPQSPAWAAELGQRLNSEGINKAQLAAWHKMQQGAPAWPKDEASAANFTKWLFEGDTTARFSGWVQKNGGK